MAINPLVQTPISSEDAAKHGIVTSLDRLLRSRHWARSLKLFSRKVARSALLGNVRSRHRGRGMEFEEVRRYQPGDDIRTIDWKVTARADGVYTKLFCEERERPCHIVVDQRSSLFFGSTTQFKSVLAAELATGLAWAALAGGDRVGGQVIGDSSEMDSRARRSRQAVLKLVHDLHAMNCELLTTPQKSGQLASSLTNSTLANSLEECQRIVRPGTAVFVISDFYDIDDNAAKALANLGKHTDISLIQVNDPLEQSLPKAGLLPVSDGENSANINMTSGLQSAYQSSLSERQQLLENAAARAGALLMPASTEHSARKTLSRIFAS